MRINLRKSPEGTSAFDGHSPNHLIQRCRCFCRLVSDADRVRRHPLSAAADMTALQEEVLAQPNARRLPARRLSEAMEAPS